MSMSDAESRLLEGTHLEPIPEKFRVDRQLFEQFEKRGWEMFARHQLRPNTHKFRIVRFIDDETVDTVRVKPEGGRYTLQTKYLRRIPRKRAKS
jgi:hypothetical protein